VELRLRFPSIRSKRLKCSPKRRRKRGFTLIEVIVATFVMALAIGTSLKVLGQGFASLDSARCLSYASQIMQSELEKMRLTSWGDGTAAGNGTTGISAYSATYTYPTIPAIYTNAGDIGSRMTMVRTAENAPGHSTGMIKITYTITWSTRNGRTMSRSYVTFYAQNGLYDFFSA